MHSSRTRNAQRLRRRSHAWTGVVLGVPQSRSTSPKTSRRMAPGAAGRTANPSTHPRHRLPPGVLRFRPKARAHHCQRGSAAGHRVHARLGHCPSETRRRAEGGLGAGTNSVRRPLGVTCIAPGVVACHLSLRPCVTSGTVVRCDRETPARNVTTMGITVDWVDRAHLARATTRRRHWSMTATTHRRGVPWHMESMAAAAHHIYHVVVEATDHSHRGVTMGFHHPRGARPQIGTHRNDLAHRGSCQCRRCHVIHVAVLHRLANTGSPSNTFQMIWAGLN